MYDIVNEFLDIDRIKPSQYRPPLSKYPYVKPSKQEVLLAQQNKLIKPILVKEIKTKLHRYYTILKGEKEWFLAQIIDGIYSLNCDVVIDEISPEDEARIIEEDLNCYSIRVEVASKNPIEEAQQLKQELSKYKNRAQYATKHKINEGSIAHQLNLLKLCKPIQNLIINPQEKKFTATHARFFHKFSDEKQIELAAKVIEKKLSCAETWKLCKDENTQFGSNEDADIKRAAERTSEKLGYPVSIKQNKSGSGSITIRYFDSDSATYLLKKLGYQGEDY